MNNQEYLRFVEAELKRILQLIEKKNHDYTGGSNQPFKNVQLVELLDVTTTETGILVRLCDKIARLAHVMKKPAKVEETVEDTILDAIGYLLMLRAYLASKKTK